MQYDIVRAVEPLALVLTCEHCDFAVLFATSETSVAVHTEDEPAFFVENQSVRPRLPTGELALACETARLHEQRYALALFPLPDCVLRNVREEEILAVRRPDWSLGPIEAVGQFFNLRVFGN